MDNNGDEQAEAHLDNICALLAGMEALRAGDIEEFHYDGEAFTDRDEITDRLLEIPLSVRVRGPWYNPGEESPPPEEYEILLCTGGPAVRMVGSLDRHSEPDSVTLQYQDWGTPWMEYACTRQQEDTLMEFAHLFLFEG